MSTSVKREREREIDGEMDVHICQCVQRISKKIIMNAQLVWVVGVGCLCACNKKTNATRTYTRLKKVWGGESRKSDRPDANVEDPIAALKPLKHCSVPFGGHPEQQTKTKAQNFAFYIPRKKEKKNG